MVPCVGASTQTASDDRAGQLWDELSLVGLPDAIDLQALFDPTGTVRFSNSDRAIPEAF